MASTQFESPSSPPMETTDDPDVQIIAPVIPCYTVPDSDEDRANQLLTNISQEINQDDSNPCEIETTDNGEASPVNTPLEPEPPSVKVWFMNTDIGRRYRHEIEKFFHSLMTTEYLRKKAEPLPKIQPRACLKLDEGCKEVTASTVIGSYEAYRNYMMDKQGWPMIANMLDQTAGIGIPQYTQVYLSCPYPPLDDAAIVEKKPIKTSKKCFNCGGEDHEVKKCPKPFDRRTFQKNRSKFLSAGLQYGRYHKDDDKSKNMKPGVISDSLRRALGTLEYEGLRDDELPVHIYKMRELGYPPGWLLEAESTNSGLAMFDKHGREVDLDGDLMEDGQVAEHRLRDENNLKYNADKIIAYPGFNMPCPEGFIDRALDSYSNLPRINPEHSLRLMSTQMNMVTVDDSDQRTTSRKRTRNDSSSSAGTSKRRKTDHHDDMDLSDGDDNGGMEGNEGSPPLIFNDEYQVIDELPPEPEDGNEQESSQTTAGDTDGDTQHNIQDTLSALEEEKQKLLAELSEMEKTEVTASTPSQSRTAIAVGAGDDPPLIALDDDDGDEVKDPTTSSTVDSANNTASSYQSRSFQVTTPIVQHSSISKLPAYEKFADGISEHLPYENLPESTGAFERMSSLMKSVRDKMSQLRPRRKK